MIKTALALAIVSLCAGCSNAQQPQDPQQANAQETAAPKHETLTLDNKLTYSVERVASFKASELPQNSDLKMVDGDLAKFAVGECALDSAPQYSPDRCDVYVQADKTGTLIGYAFVYHDYKGTFLTSRTSINERKQPGGTGCALSGPIYYFGEQSQRRISDPSKDFSGQIMYQLLENDLVAPVDLDSDEEPTGSLGVWYIKKQGDKLRIEEERWNYCYKSPDVSVDDVFYRAVSLVLQK